MVKLSHSGPMLSDIALSLSRQTNSPLSRWTYLRSEFLGNQCRRCSPQYPPPGPRSFQIVRDHRSRRCGATATFQQRPRSTAPNRPIGDWGVCLCAISQLINTDRCFMLRIGYAGPPAVLSPYYSQTCYLLPVFITDSTVTSPCSAVIW